MTDLHPITGCAS